MTPCRVHILGASGAGTTTLGRALAAQWAVPHHDTDDYFWEPTEQPYTVKRDPAERLTLMRQMFVPRRAWVLSGSLIAWGDALIPELDLVVFLKIDPLIRMARLKAREELRLGAKTIAPGGASHASYLAFMEWATGYDHPDFTGRSLKRHSDWLAKLPCPVLALDSSAPLGSLVAQVLSARIG
ncbi:MAG: hypothetical protein ABI459_07130 [Deltaproteobacteria bacterium]